MTWKKLITLGTVAIFAAGCVSTSGGPKRSSNKVCMAVAAAAVGGYGAHAAQKREHSDDHAVWGALAGAAVGAGLGYLLCPGAEKMPPTARASAEPNSGDAPLSTQLRGVGSDVDGQVVSYAWDFGDGGTGSGQNAGHTYSAPGNYFARLTVTDNDGLTGSTTVPIRVAAAAAAEPVVQRRIVLRGVNFAFDSDALTSEALVILEAAVEALNEANAVNVQVAGHTDSVGTDAYNQGLSERRASAVRDYLAKRGISSSRLSVAGFGESKPVASNDTDDGRAQNRRVELNIR